MLSKVDDRIWSPLIIGLTVSACLGHNPASSVAAIGVILVVAIADRYFTNCFFDDHQKDIEKLQADYLRLKERQDKTELSGAFKPRVQ